MVTDSREHLAQWVEWTDGMVQRVQDAARTAPLGGDDAWWQLMAELEAEPLPPEERVAAMQGAPTSRGALPIEVRRCLQRIVDRASEPARRFDDAIDPSDPRAQQSVDRWQHRLADLVEQETQRYIDAVRPAPTTASIFATALASARPMTDKTTGPGVSTVICPSCGAPRGRDEGSSSCRYCGADIFGGGPCSSK